jgi:predicted metalloprotease with PDZ domain
MASVTYTIRVLPTRHELAVELTLEGHRGPEVRLRVPTWVPGAYAFLRYGRNVVDVTAHDAPGGQPLTVTREGWTGFVVHGAGPSLRVTYTVYQGDWEWSEMAGVVQEDQALLTGTCHLQVLGHDGPVTTRYLLPDGWDLHHPSGADLLSPTSFRHPSHDHFVDTPVVTGRFTRLTRDVAGTPFHFIFLDRCVGFSREVDRFLDDADRVARLCHHLFGGFPFRDYTYIVTFSDRCKWGLEHRTSTTLAFGPDGFIAPPARSAALRVLAHELFHAYNAWALRPAAFIHPDLGAGSFTDTLWLVEGATRYYEFILLSRAGLLSPAQVLGNIVNYHRHLDARPGFRRASVRDASQSTFLNHHRFAGAVNCSFDYYDHGMLAAFNLDARLRTASHPSSLDQVLASFLPSHPGGYTTDGFLDHVATSSPEAAERLRRELGTPGVLDVEDCLARLGFRVDMAQVPYLGVVLVEEKGPRLLDVLDDSPAGRAGLMPGDDVVALDGFPFSVPALAYVVTQERRVRLTVRRGQGTREFDVEAATRPQVGRLSWTGSPSQLEVTRTWLGAPAFDPTPGLPLDLSAHDNFHGVHTVY